MQNLFTIYPEYDKLYGPYQRKADNRAVVVLRNTATKKQYMMQYAKLLLELQLNRKLVFPETVDHIDGNLLNDSISNLQVLIHAQNCRKSSLGNSYSKGFKQSEAQKRSGSKNGKAKFTDKQIAKIKEDFVYNSVTKETLITNLQINRRTLENLLKGTAYVNAGGPLSKFKRGRKKTKTDSGEIG